MEGREVRRRGGRDEEDILDRVGTLQGVVRNGRLGFVSVSLVVV